MLASLCADARYIDAVLVSQAGAAGYGDCSMLSFVDQTNRDARYTTTVLFKDDAPPAAGWFFDDVDWGEWVRVAMLARACSARVRPDLQQEADVLMY